MIVSKHKSLLSFLSIVLVIAIATPSIVKLHHAVKEHLENTCTSQGTLHFHEAELDCAFHKFHLNSHFYPEFTSFILYPPKDVFTTTYSTYTFLSEFQRFHFALKAPPCLS